MSYTFSWELKNPLSPADFISWEMEEDEEPEDKSLFIDTPDFDTDEIL